MNHRGEMKFSANDVGVSKLCRTNSGELALLPRSLEVPGLSPESETRFLYSVVIVLFLDHQGKFQADYSN
jgi:hypothetical protein